MLPGCAEGYDGALSWCTGRSCDMTYCLAMQLRDGLVFAADSRTTAGVDNVSTYRKLHVFQPGPDRFLVVLTSGSLATSQEVLDRLRRDLDATTPGQRSLRTVNYLFEAAQYLGRILSDVQTEHGSALRDSGINGAATLIVGGQIAGKPPALYLVYPEGNYIPASEQTPFLQLGEFKYGKPMLSRIAAQNLSLEDGARLAVVSLDATMKSNISVGPPLDIAIYRNDEMQLSHHLSLDADSPLLVEMLQTWNDSLLDAFKRLPRFDWESGAEQARVLGLVPGARKDL
jgi:putative proteasome-type protease